MRISIAVCFLFLFFKASAQRSWSIDNLWPEDWLIKKPTRKAEVIYRKDENELILYNGLVKRSFRLLPNASCIDYRNMINGQQLLRAISPEARLTIDGKEYNIGGLHGQ